MIDYTKIKKLLIENKINTSAIKYFRFPDGKAILGQATYAKIMAGDTDINMTVKTIEDLCQLFQCQPIDLLKDCWKIELDTQKSIDAIRDAEQAKKDAAKKEKATNIKK